MWEVYEHQRMSKEINKLPKEILRRYEKWKDIAKVSGPHGLLLVRGFRDEALKGKWNGYRSSRLGLHYRVIYQLEDQLFYVFRLSLHDYRS